MSPGGILRKNRRGFGQRGQSLVEFALLAPLLLVLFMGMFDFGWILHKQIQMDNAVRVAARRGAVQESNDQIIKKMLDTCTFGITVDQITIDVRDSAGVSIGNPDDRTPGNRIYVAIDVPDVKLVTPLRGLIDTVGTINLHSEAEFLIE